MINSKQRSYLRSLANRLEPIFQIGKGGIEENLLSQLSDALEAREIIKINVLETSGLSPREASDIICSKLHAEGIQAIGNKLTIYRRSEKKPRIELP